MLWNWQQANWPHFTYDSVKQSAAEAGFIKAAGIVIGAMDQLDQGIKFGLTVQLLSQGVVDSSAIEGDILDRASVQSSLAKHLGFKSDYRRAGAAEAGASEMMADVYKNYAEFLSETTMFAWHKMLMNGRRDLTSIGAYRTLGEPMQIVSGSLHALRVHFEAPPAHDVHCQMIRFVNWFNESGPSGSNPLPAITRAGIAHLWFESIHPFEDGNGRIGRALAEKSLSQSLQAPILTALSEAFNRNRKAYYRELHLASQTNKIDAWLNWFGQICLDAQAMTTTQVRFIVQKTKFMDTYGAQINDRQEKALLRLFAEGPSGFAGGLSSNNYQTITNATSATSTRDLLHLVQIGALTREGQLKGTRYHLAMPPLDPL